ncbi:hypothetical protein NDU88_003043 [Pleurodeles waltl]|uniref:Reverse transcriptase/retrotransposon-derived protein RNase H-like domain-containing protein n=1 Tax=Pleurodeles waltl TaxID=8319 RepID=A0AAV7T5D3_PLEWA|nr:hypothetical protein NDU88_003043 [Pleurodeles waltl]
MRNFDAVSSVILSNIKGEAVALVIRQRLRETPHQEQERQLPKIISDTYTSIGRDSLGAKPKKLELQAERDWPSEHVRKLPHGEDVTLPSFSDLVPEADKEAYASEWASRRHLRYIAIMTYIPDYAQRIKLLYDLVQPTFSSRHWTIEHTRILKEMQQDMLEAKHLHTCDNKTNVFIRIIAGAIGFTYVTFNEDDTVPIAYKSHLYSSAEKRFAPTEKILKAVQMAFIKERPLAQGKRIIVVSPVPALEAVTKASVPNAKAVHPRWIQWATSLTTTDVDYIFDPKLQTQELLQYEQEYPAPLNILPLDRYHTVIYTDGSAQPAVGTKHQYSAACAAVCGVMEDGVFHPHNTYTQTLGDCTAQF